jgi:hypothetical protein
MDETTQQKFERWLYNLNETGKEQAIKLLFFNPKESRKFILDEIEEFNRLFPYSWAQMKEEERDTYLNEYLGLREMHMRERR